MKKLICCLFWVWSLFSFDEKIIQLDNRLISIEEDAWDALRLASTFSSKKLSIMREGLKCALQKKAKKPNETLFVSLQQLSDIYPHVKLELPQHSRDCKSDCAIKGEGETCSCKVLIKINDRVDTIYSPVLNRYLYDLETYHNFYQEHSAQICDHNGVLLDIGAYSEFGFIHGVRINSQCFSQSLYGDNILQSYAFDKDPLHCDMWNYVRKKTVAPLQLLTAVAIKKNYYLYAQNMTNFAPTHTHPNLELLHEAEKYIQFEQLVKKISNIEKL